MWGLFKKREVVELQLPIDLEVLREGTPPESRRLVGTCATCGAVVRYRRVDELPRSPYTNFKSAVLCPTKGCGGAIYGDVEPPSAL